MQVAQISIYWQDRNCLKIEDMENTEQKTTAEGSQVIEAHKKIAEYLTTAAQKHISAAQQYEEGEYDEARDSLENARHHTNLASEAQMEMLKHYPFTS